MTACVVMLKDVQSTKTEFVYISKFVSISKDFCLKDQIYFCLKIIITQKLSAETTNRTQPTSPRGLFSV